jgi:hypothetical protein
MEFTGIGPGFFVFATIAGFAAFALGSTFGVGGAMLLTAVLLLGMPAPLAVAVIVPAMLINSALTFWVHREHLDPRAAWRVGVMVVPTAIVAALFTDQIDHSLLQALIGLAIVAALLTQYGLGQKIRVRERGLFAWGVAVGSLGGLCGTAGPPLALGLRSYGLNGTAFVATAALIKALLHLPRIPTYARTGLLSGELLPLAITLAVMSVAGVWAGKRLLERLDPTRFRGSLDVLLAVLAILLIAGSLR